MAVSAIQGVTMSTVKADLESISPNQALWLQKYEENKWSDIDENGVTGGVFVYGKRLILPSGICAPVAINYDVDKVAVFLVGYDNLAWAGLGTSDTAFTWNAVGDGVKKFKGGSLSGLGRAYDNRISLIGIELGTGQLFHTWTEAGNVWATSWESWTGSGFCLSNPVIVSCNPFCIDIFVFIETHGLKRISHRKGAGWGTWQSCDGHYAPYDPTAVSVSPGRIDVFTIGSDGQLYQLYVTLTANEVGTLTSRCLGGYSLSSPKTTVIAPGAFSVITKKTKGVYQQKFYESSTGVWTPQDGMTEVQSV